MHVARQGLLGFARSWSRAKIPRAAPGPIVENPEVRGASRTSSPFAGVARRVMRTEVRPQDWSHTTIALRHLAGELVGGDEQGEDLVQGTLVAALEHPPRVLSWSWLVSVLRNRARDLGRERQRRGPNLEIPALASSLPDAAEVAQRLELQEALTGALRALDEPYKSTLYLRYFEDLTPSEIARRTGVPVKTIKTRLERGLERLRQRLEHRHGPDLRGLLLLLGPLGPGRAATIVSVSTAGGLLLMWKKIAIVAALICAGFLWWRVEPSGRGDDIVSASPAAATPALESAPAAPTSPAAPDSPAQSGRSAALESFTPKREVSSLGSLRVQVLWSDETPAAGIGLNFRRAFSARGSAPRGVFRATCDDAGQARLSALSPGTISVSTSRGDTQTADVVAGEERELVLHIATGIHVAGRVLDSRDAPVGDAEIFLTSFYNDWLGMSVVAHSDANGLFQLRDVQAQQSLGAIVHGHAPSKLVDLELLEVHSNLVEVTLRVGEVGGSVQGQVSDAGGSAVAGANVCVGVGEGSDFRAYGGFVEHWAPRQTQTDSAGRFRFEGLAAKIVLVSVLSGSAPQWTGSIEIRAGASVELPVVLQEGVLLSGIVRDAAGAPVPRAVVHAFKSALNTVFIAMGQYDDPSVFGSPMAITDEAGRYQVTALWPGETHVYASPPRDAKRFEPEIHAESVLHPAPGEHLEWNPTLEPGRTIRGHTRFSDGEPMGNVFVTAIEDGSAEQRVLNVGDDGRFEFFNLPAGPFRLEVQLFAQPPDGGPLFKTGVVPDGVELELVADFPSPEKNPSARVHGRFADPLGRFARPLAATLQTPGGIGYYPARSNGAEFEFRDLAAGHYRMLGHFAEAIGYCGEDFELRRGEDLDLGTLQLGPGANLTVHLKRAPGLEAVQLSGYLHPRASIWGTSLDFSQTDEVVLANLNMGEYELRLQGGTDSAQLVRRFDLQGDLLLELPVRPCALAKIELGFALEAARGELHITIHGADGELFEDTRWTRGWNGSAPFMAEYGLPVGRFTVQASTSVGLGATGDLVVESTGKSPATLKLELH